MSIDLRGRRILVVGASGGIGAATADAFEAAGADVARPGRAALDITDETSIQAFFAASADFEHVVVAAAATTTGSVAKLAQDDADAAMNSKFFGAYRVARHARIADGGSLTFVSGFLSTRPSASAVLQGAINAALEALARGLALEMAPVRVNAVSPGLVATSLWNGMADADRQAMFDGAAKRLPARRVGLGDPVPDRVGGRFELSGQVLGIAAGSDQIDHLLPEFRRVVWARLGHGGTPRAKASSVSIERILLANA